MTVWMGSASTSQELSRSAASLALSSCSLLMPVERTPHRVLRRRLVKDVTKCAWPLLWANSSMCMPMDAAMQGWNFVQQLKQQLQAPCTHPAPERQKERYRPT
jgi:hypothetical protein